MAAECLPIFVDHSEFLEFILDLADNGKIDEPVRRMKVERLRDALTEALI